MSSTPAQARLEKIEELTIGLSSLATLIEWAGTAASQVCLHPTSQNLSAFGCAMQWAGKQVERMSDDIREEAIDERHASSSAFREVA